MHAQNDGRYRFSPTDLVNFLGCAHATVLDLRALTEPIPDIDESEHDKLLRQKGDEHEMAFLNKLRAEGRQIIEIPRTASSSERRKLTDAAMSDGAEVIFQAALADDRWAGYADFLIRVEGSSALGSYHYEALDTKLARHPQVKHLIQLGVYSLLLQRRQELAPRHAHLVLGDQRTETFRVADFTAYVHHAMRRLEAFAEQPPADSYPEPCAHCGLCRWNSVCTDQWENDNHLCLVANLQRSQSEKLRRSGITTLAQLAALPTNTRIPDLNPQVCERLRSQAALQHHRQTTGENRCELIACEPGRGFARLPHPDPGDLFFDMEGDPLFPDGLEYLFGVCQGAAESLQFRPFWAHNHTEERDAFTAFMAFVQTHLSQYPNAHIYHYNHYELTALKRLACRYGVAEHFLDHLLRSMKFVDLYKVVREALRVSEPGYSIKNLEVFYMPARDGSVTNAGDSIVVYNRWRETGDEQLLKDIAEYNEIDCRSTAMLRDWLLSLRPDHASWFTGPPPADDAEKSADRVAARTDREERYARVQAALSKGVTDLDDYRRHTIDLLEFHAREGRPQWWEFFARQDRFPDELIDDAECLAGLTQANPPTPVKKSLLHTFSFPPQETKRRAGDDVFDVATLIRAGTIESLDDIRLTVQLKRNAAAGPLPESLSVGPGGPINTDALREAIYRFAESSIAGDHRYAALRDILNRRPPRLHGRSPGQPITVGSDLVAASIDAVAQLDHSYLFIQGPPGAGKTHSSAHIIVELMRRGKSVGVAANSHKAIHNLLAKVEHVAQERGVSFDGYKKASSGNPDSEYDGPFIDSVTKNDAIPPSAQLMAGSAWLFADPRFDQHLDYLFIDEAGQVAVANLIAMGTAAKNIVLVGDQMQLGQPIQGVHPGDAGLSILDFLLRHQATVAADRGIFLDQTRRLHSRVCRFISEAFYDGRLAPHADNDLRRLTFASPIPGLDQHGICFVPVEHSGCSQKSEEEGAALAGLYRQLIGQSFTDRDGSNRPVSGNDILVVSPYNVQVNHLISVLPGGARVGTVDKFQGQEAPIVLVSMATSDAECLPRDIEFLFSANRLNVALSRAQCLAVVFANPRLLEVPCRTADQLRLVNQFCRLWEYAGPERRAEVTV